MWQSSQWNGLSSAERILSFLVLTLLLLHFPEAAINNETKDK
jgi:predicted small integral membrane protein